MYFFLSVSRVHSKPKLHNYSGEGQPSSARATGCDWHEPWFVLLTNSSHICTGGALESVNSYVVHTEKHREDLLREAVRSARAQAELLAKETRTKLGGVCDFSLECDYSGDFHERLDGAPAATSARGAGVNMPLGSQTVSASVKVTFELLV